MPKVFNQLLTLSLVCIALIVAVGGILAANGSFAWFADNDNVAGDGIEIGVKVSPNLIISKNDGEIGEIQTQFSVSFTDKARTDMIPVTRDGNVPDTFLKYIYNHYAVDKSTGLAKPGTELEFENVPTEDNEAYFIDCTVYLATTLSAIEVDALSAKIVPPENIDSLPPYCKAASVDVYVDTVSGDGYAGTLSVGNADVGVEIFGEGGGTIPLNTTGCIKVILRCYFDGALTDAATETAYVNSATVKTDSMSFGVEFTATEAEN